MTDIKIVRSNRRTMSLEVTRDGEVLVRAPKTMAQSVIDRFVTSHAEWINRNVKKQLERKAAKPDLSEQDIAALKQKAKEILPKKVDAFSRLTGLCCTGVKITSAKTRFGSCSGKNSICFSYHLMRYPEEAVDYVVLHELAHTRHHNHSKQFWALVEKFMPDYKQRQKLLKG